MSRRIEDGIQIAMFDALHIYEKRGYLLAWHVPNGGFRFSTTAGLLKRLGTRAGIPDICVALKGGRMLFAEVKTPRGKLKEAQEDIMEVLETLGHRVEIWRSVEDMARSLRDWGVPDILGLIPRETEARQ